jgi:hypothetical protein
MKKNKYLLAFILLYVGIILFWNWITDENSSPIGLFLFQLPLFLLCLIIIVIIDWAFMQKKIGRKTVIISELILLFIFFIIVSIKTAHINYKIDNDTHWFIIVYADNVQNNEIKYSFPLNKSINIKKENLNFIDTNKIGFRSEQIKCKKYYCSYHTYRFLFNDTLHLSGKWINKPDFAVYEIEPYKLTTDDLENIDMKINNYMRLFNIHLSDR